MTIFTTHYSRLRIIGLSEGISLLLLLGVAMPLKYAYGIPEATKAIGMIHGVLFIVYIGVVVFAHWKLNWKFGRTALLLAASVIPFGTIYADRKVFKELSAKQ